MQTNFTPDQLVDPAMAASEAVIRKCVHCGFCTATCPTYVLLGDELDSPRGRIYLMKDMLENERTPSAEVVKHIDRRSEEHTSELQSLMRNSYAVFCLKKKKQNNKQDI